MNAMTSCPLCLGPTCCSEHPVTHMCDMTHSRVCQDSFMCVTWIIHMCDMTHVYVRNDVMSSFPSSTCYRDSLRLVGSLKLQVSFAKEPYKTDDILQKRPIVLRSLLIVATPYRDSPVIHVCDMRDSFICVTWHIHMCDMTRSYV